MTDDWTKYDVAWGDPTRKPSLRQSPKPGSPVTADTKLLVVAGVLLAFALLLGGGLAVRYRTNAFHKQMISDAVAQYQIVLAGSDSYEKAIRAGVVADAYLAAKDSTSYHEWKKISDDWMAVFNARIKANTQREIDRSTREMMRQLDR
jgi:hypothetical protein